MVEGQVTRCGVIPQLSHPVPDSIYNETKPRVRLSMYIEHERGLTMHQVVLFRVTACRSVEMPRAPYCPICSIAPSTV